MAEVTVDLESREGLLLFLDRLVGKRVERVWIEGDQVKLLARDQRDDVTVTIDLFQTEAPDADTEG